MAMWLIVILWCLLWDCVTTSRKFAVISFVFFLPPCTFPLSLSHTIHTENTQECCLSFPSLIHAQCTPPELSSLEPSQQPTDWTKTISESWFTCMAAAFPNIGWHSTGTVRVGSSLWVHKLFTTLELSKIQIKLEAPSNHLHKIGGSFHSNLWQVPGGLGIISLQWCRLSGFPGLGLHSSPGWWQGCAAMCHWALDHFGDDFLVHHGLWPMRQTTGASSISLTALSK